MPSALVTDLATGSMSVMSAIVIVTRWSFANIFRSGRATSEVSTCAVATW